MEIEKYSLEEYPEAIAKIERAILSLERDRDGQQKNADRVYLLIDTHIVWDPTLKNDQQRKVKREELIAEHPNLEVYLSYVVSKKAEIEALKIALNQLRNEFTILKLRLREKIAHQQLISELPLIKDGQTFTT